MEPQNGLIFTHIQGRGDPRPADLGYATGNGLRSSLRGLWGAQAAAGWAGGWPKEYNAGLVPAFSAGLVQAQVRKEDVGGTHRVGKIRWQMLDSLES